MMKTLALTAALATVALAAHAETGRFGRSTAYDIGNPSVARTGTFSTIEPAAGPGEAPAMAIQPVVEVTTTTVETSETPAVASPTTLMDMVAPVSGTTPASHTDVVTPTTAAK